MSLTKKGKDVWIILHVVSNYMQVYDSKIGALRQIVKEREGLRRCRHSEADVWEHGNGCYYELYKCNEDYLDHPTFQFGFPTFMDQFKVKDYCLDRSWYNYLERKYESAQRRYEAEERKN